MLYVPGQGSTSCSSLQHTPLAPDQLPHMSELSSSQLLLPPPMSALLSFDSQFLCQLTVNSTQTANITPLSQNPDFQQGTTQSYPTHMASLSYNLA